MIRYWPMKSFLLVSIPRKTYFISLNASFQFFIFSDLTTSENNNMDIRNQNKESLAHKIPWNKQSNMKDWITIQMLLDISIRVNIVSCCKRGFKFLWKTSMIIRYTILLFQMKMVLIQIPVMILNCKLKNLMSVSMMKFLVMKKKTSSLSPI